DYYCYSTYSTYNHGLF
nr:immunoglobulin light chain junction region [Macaca mulatta]MOX33600.1 immunoglobulin light chain junction region [Macaca mulatta]MOX34950.1 immunoglobulin light chain junction region [Macaca mulatta]